MHKPNVTVAAVVKAGNQFLCVKERDKHTNEIVYNQPAGHLEQNETLVQAAKRELEEETGLKLEPLGLVGVYNLHAQNGTHYLRFLFYFECNAPLLCQPKDSDILSAHWLTLDKLSNLNLRSSLVMKGFLDATAKPLTPLDFIYD